MQDAEALIEPVIGLYEIEVIRRRGLEDVEFATLEWVWCGSITTVFLSR